MKKSFRQRPAVNSCDRSGSFVFYPKFATNQQPSEPTTKQGTKEGENRGKYPSGVPPIPSQQTLTDYRCPRREPQLTIPFSQYRDQNAARLPSRPVRHRTRPPWTGLQGYTALGLRPSVDRWPCLAPASPLMEGLYLLASC